MSPLIKLSAAACLAVIGMAAQDDSLAPALDALQRSDYSAAEQLLRRHLRARPADADALGLLGVVLDQEKNFAEADDVYRSALRTSPRNPALLNNFGNHLIATGNAAGAQKQFLQVLSLEPANANALVQLARISLENNKALDALRFLDRVSTATRNRSDVIVLRMQALYLAGQPKEADAVLARLSSEINAPDRQYLLAEALASARQYSKAEEFYSRYLKANPGDFTATYRLGLAAAHAGHNQLAQNTLQSAMVQQPGNVDVLYDLAAVDAALNDKEKALALLAEAARLAPNRADITELLARISASLGYFADAVRGWDAYLKLMPGNQVAVRERAFAQTAIGQNVAASLATLTDFTRRRPSDPVGHYQLGVALTALEPAQALEELTKALTLKSDFSSAHLARGLLLYRQGQAEKARQDFELAAQQEPGNAVILDRLSEAYTALGRFSDALTVLRKAAGLAPDNSTVLLHLGRALSRSGQPQEAAAIFARSHELGVNRSQVAHPPGLMDYLSLSPDEQLARYRKGVEQTVRHDPANAEAQVRLLGLLLDDGRVQDAAGTVKALAALNTLTSLKVQAVRMLLAAGQYSLARDLLDANGGASSHELAVDLAIVDFRLSGAEAGLKALAQIPEGERQGNYDLALLLMREAQHRDSDADACLQRLVHSAAHADLRLDLYVPAIAALLSDARLPQARSLLSLAAKANGGDPEVQLLQAIASELEGDAKTADLQFAQIEKAWPQWHKAWRAHIWALEARGQQASAARLKLELVSAADLRAGDPSLDAITVSDAAEFGKSLLLLFP